MASRTTVVLDEPTNKEINATTIDNVHDQIVAVDDDPVALRILSRHLQGAGYQTIAIDNGETALEVVSNETAVVLLDLHMPGLSGLDCLRFLQKRNPDVRVVILTGSSDVQDAVDAMHGGAFEYVTKPYDPAELLVHVKNSVRLEKCS